MTGFHLLFGGFGAGLAMAAPVGPVAALCISVTLRRGTAHGMMAGLGAALGDALFAAIAVFGFAGVSNLLHGHDAAFRFVGGIILSLVALRRLRRPMVAELVPSSAAEPHENGGSDGSRGASGSRLPTSFLGPMLLTLGNPATILSFVAVLGALGLTGVEVGPHGSFLVTMGVFVGALAWWAFVASVAGRLRGRSGPRTLARLDRLVTVLLLVFAAALMISAFLPLGLH